MSAPASAWPIPKRILLLTYDRIEHAEAAIDRGIVGVTSDPASRTKASRVRPNDWVLLRFSFDKAVVRVRPLRVVGRPFMQGPSSPYPNLLFSREVEEARVIYPLRIPITMDDGPVLKEGYLTWDALASLHLRGKDGYVLETPQQWGIKFATSVLEDASDVEAMVGLVLRCAV